MARVLIKPIEPLIIEFQDGKELKALFNNEAFVCFTEEFGAVDKAAEESEEVPFNFYSKVLYCGLKVMQPKITLEEAETIMVQGGQALMLEIASSTIDNFMVTANGEAKKKFEMELGKQLNQKEMKMLKEQKII